MLRVRFPGRPSQQAQLATDGDHRVHAGDGSLLAEYAVERRTFVPVSAIPKQVINAFLSAEDKNFYRHPGVDVGGVARAAVTNLRNYGKGRRPEGACGDAPWKGIAIAK